MGKRYSVWSRDRNPQILERSCLRCHFTISISSLENMQLVWQKSGGTDRQTVSCFMSQWPKKRSFWYISVAVSIQRGYEVAALALWLIIQQFERLQQDWISFTGKFWALLQQWNNKRNNCGQIPCYNPRLCELYLTTPTGHRLRREDRRQLIWSQHLHGLHASLPVSSLNHTFLWISFLKIQKTCI